GSSERDLTQNDRLTLIVRHELARYQIPNELVQQNGAYLPNSDNDTGCPSVPPDQEPDDCVYISGGSCRMPTTLKLWGALPTSTCSHPMRSGGSASWPAIIPMIFTRIRRHGLLLQPS